MDAQRGAERGLDPDGPTHLMDCRGSAGEASRENSELRLRKESNMKNDCFEQSGLSVAVGTTEPVDLLTLACSSAQLRSARRLAPCTAATQHLSARICRAMAKLGAGRVEIGDSPYWPLLEHRASYEHAREVGRREDAERQVGCDGGVTAEDAEPYVMERRIQGYFAISTRHPVIGWLYWSMVPSDNDEPDYRTLTEHVNEALLLAPGYLDGPHSWIYDRFLSSILSDNRSELDPESGRYLAGSLAWLADQARMTHEAFDTWMLNAQWSECVVPEQVFYLEDMDGFNGYRPVWTRRHDQALRLSLSDDLEDIRHLGQLVPLQRAVGLG